MEVQDDIPSMLHGPRKVYVGKDQYPISRENNFFGGLQNTSELVNARSEQIARKKRLFLKELWSYKSPTKKKNKDEFSVSAF